MRSNHCSRTGSRLSSTTKAVILAAALFVAGVGCLAQEGPKAHVQSGRTAAQTTEKGTVTVPAGARIPLILTHPIRSISARRGDIVFAQTTSPVVSGDKVAIPAGTSVQGKLDKVGKEGGRGNLHLQSLSLVFDNGYIVSIPGPLELKSAEGYALKDAGTRRSVGVFVLPVAGMGLGALVGHAAGSSKDNAIPTGLPPFSQTPVSNGSRLKSTAIGSVVGLAAGSVASLVLFASTREFYVETGTPLETVLRDPLTLDEHRLAEAVPRPATTPIMVGPKTPIMVGPQLPAPSAGAAKSPWDCGTGQEWCGGRCVDTISFVSDSSNCGRCNNRCSFSETCTGGSCVCGPGYSSCMGGCVSDASFHGDSSNCGRCGNQCSIGESCMGGTCMKMFP